MNYDMHTPREPHPETDESEIKLCPACPDSSGFSEKGLEREREQINKGREIENMT